MSSPLELPSLVAGTAIGGAAVAAFQPALERPRQDAWSAAPNRLPDVGLLAALVAGGKIELASAEAMAKRLGYDTGPFDSLVWLAQNRLDFPLMLRLWRLGAALPQFKDPDANGLVDRTLAHEQLDWNYQPYLKALRLAELPGIGDIAYGVVRGYLPTDIPLPVPPPATSTNVKRFPQSTTKAETLAAAIGWDSDMLELMIARSGLSLAPGLAAQAYFRGIIADDDYHLAIAEGDLRTEWADVLRGASRAIPTSGEIVEHRLRGWSTQQEMYDGTARHGMSQADTDLLYQTTRRPMTVPNITKALARGGTFNPEAGELTDPYNAAVHQANLGPEWYNLAEALKYTMPSAFVIRSLLTDGALTEAEGEQLFLDSGWRPDLAKTVATHYATSTGTVADKHVGRAQTQLWTTTHRAYLNSKATDAEATTALTAAGVDPAAIPQVLALWQEERALDRKTLSAAQIKKAWGEAVINPDTGAAWTKDEALAALIEIGYDPSDAATFLEL